MKRTASLADCAAIAILGLLVAFASSWTAQGGAPWVAAGGGELKNIERSIRDCIGWAKNKDFRLLYSVIANDPDFLEVHPDGAVVKGFEDFKKAEKTWNSPDFKAVRYEIRDLRIKLSRSGDVAWFFCILDDINEWKGRPANWENTRWTGVLEKRDGRWIMAQQHFSSAEEEPLTLTYVASCDAFPLDPNCAPWLQETLKPGHIALTHLPIRLEGDAPGKIDQVRKYYKDIFLLMPGFPARTLR